MQAPTDEYISNVWAAMSELTTGAAIMDIEVEFNLYGDDWHVLLMDDTIQCSLIWCKTLINDKDGNPQSIGHWKDVSDLVDAHPTLEHDLYEAAQQQLKIEQGNY